MGEMTNRSKKAVSWFASNEGEENGDQSDEEVGAVIIRRKTSYRPNQGKSKSLEPGHKTLTKCTTAASNFTVYRNELKEISSGERSESSKPRNWRRSHYRIGKLNTRLLEAVEAGDIEEITRLLKLGGNPNATCRLNHVSACHIAAMINNDSLSLLVRSGADSFRTDRLGRTPLHLAAWEGNLKQIAVLLDLPEDLQNEVVDMTPEIAIKVNRHSSVKHQLTNLPCNIGQLLPLPQTWNDSTEHNCRRIKENLPLFKPGWTALHSASARAQFKCVQLLLAAGADPRARDLIGRNPLDVVGAAHSSGHKIEVHNFRETVRILLGADAKFHTTRVCLNNVNTPLHTAVELESVEAVEQLLDAGASATCHNTNGLTPMHLCVEKELKEPLQVLANYEYIDQDPYLATVDLKDKKGQTVLHAAVRRQWTDGVRLALGAGASIFMKANDGDTPIHLAAAIGNVNIVQEILTVAKYALDSRNQKGETALCKAITHNHIEMVKMLIENGASLKHILPDRKNVLHLAARYGHVDILQYLLNCGSCTIASLINDEQPSYSPIIFAVVYNHSACVELLLSKGAHLDSLVPIQDDISKEMVLTTALHIAAAKNHFEIARIIVEFDSETIHKVNGAGLLPLHEACFHGNREIISLLVHKGADLSRQAEHSKMKLTPLQMLMNNLSKPTAYMEEVFDSYVSSRGRNLQDRNCMVTVNYDILAPNSLDGRQMAVIKALVNTGNRYEQRKLLLHPLIESFLFLKWRALLPFFYVIIALYALFVLSLNVYIVSVFYYQDKNRNISTIVNTTATIQKPPLILHSGVWKYMIYVTVGLITFQEIMFIKIRNKRYFLFLETWVKFGSIGLSILLPSVISWPASDVATDAEYSPEWARLIATIALLLSWVELMFLLSRFPSWGFYVLMFGKVAKKVFKILLTFTFLIFGFSLCFMVQFRAKSPFDEPWAAVTKTLVMMTSEYDYMSMINKQNARDITASIIILRLIFITFVILASIVLLNLMVGVAVNDVNNLEEIGNQKRLEKQVDFLASLDEIVCHKAIRNCLPRKFNSKWSLRKKVNNFIILRPREATCIYSKIFPSHIREAIFEKAQLQKKQMDDELGSMAYHMKLDEIHDAIVGQDDKLARSAPTLDVAMFNEAFNKINRQIEELHNDMNSIKKLLTRRYTTDY